MKRKVSFASVTRSLSQRSDRRSFSEEAMQVLRSKLFENLEITFDNVDPVSQTNS